AVADTRLRLLAGDQSVTSLEPFRGQNVRLLAVLVLDQGDAGRAIRVVLDRLHRRPDVVLPALEVDEAVTLLVAAAAEARADEALVVAAALLGLGAQQRFLRPVLLAVRQLREVADRAAAAAGARRVVEANAHWVSLTFSRGSRNRAVLRTAAKR